MVLSSSSLDLGLFLNSSLNWSPGKCIEVLHYKRSIRIRGLMRNNDLLSYSNILYSCHLAFDDTAQWLSVDENISQLQHLPNPAENVFCVSISKGGKMRLSLLVDVSGSNGIIISRRGTRMLHISSLLRSFDFRNEGYLWSISAIYAALGWQILWNI